MKREHQDSPLFKQHEIPFETAYCLKKIGKQPDEYDGPERFCRKRASKKDDSEYEGGPHCEAAYAMFCRFHGGDAEKYGRQQSHRLEDPRTVAITHGTWTEDEHLRMDFDEHEKELYDRIMEQWPEIYDWPDRSEDPARYRILRRVAVNEVRALRQEDHLEEVGETQEVPVLDEDGVEVSSYDEENPISREYRLLMSEVTDQMRELGLTPKERQKMDTMEAQESKDDALTRVADDALEGGEYDPTQFDE
jgi:hypothetical protein